MIKLIRITTVPVSLHTLLKGQLSYVNRFIRVIGISSPGEMLNETKSREGIDVFSVKMKRKPSPLIDIISIFRLYKKMKEEKPDIVHTHTPKAGMCGMIAARLSKVPIRIHTVAGMPLMESVGIKRKLFLFIERLTYNCASLVLPNSNGLYEFILSEKLVSCDKSEVIGFGSSNGIDTSFFSIDKIMPHTKVLLREKYTIRQDDVVLLFVGRLVGDKGINELVASFKNIQQKHSNLKLLLVGPREDHLDPLESETINEILNNPYIVEAGWQGDVRPFMAISDMLVFPSYREGFPNVVMQAGAMGLPSIVTDINGCNEIIVNDQNGVIIPPKDSQALTKACLNLIEDDNKRIRYASCAREMIQNRYEQQYVWSKMLKMYKEQLDKAGVKNSIVIPSYECISRK
ncbi:glycosyltransferase family 4 protein [Halosquirtibacter xylanolyticus]|uniref:glycosyltransferase family 4 protein n=1 Tax=Halosquirtibacter xylanolyticus TaxID=3374599 RepID=UPI00374A2FA3|nr:glycosyltransferase family 4 protein [Prolixibacteraceae bacterium]